MNLLFAQSYILREDPKEWKNMAPYPPLGTLYAAGRARDAGHDVRVFDAMLAEGPEEIVPLLRESRPDVLVIYDDDFNYLTKMCLTRMREVAFEFARYGKEAGAIVVLHSSDATDHRLLYLNAGADYLMIGESEETLVELLEKLESGDRAGAAAVPGVCSLEEENHLLTAPPRPVTRDLDTISFPARDLVEVDRYREIWRRHHGRFSMNMVTTRGCPFHCNWCAKPLYGQIYSSRSPANVAEEVAHIVQTWNPDHLWFCDDIFGLKPGWVESFAEELAARDVHVPFKALSRADLLLRGRTIDALGDAGCETIWIGAESGAQSVLDAMQKGTTVEQIEEGRRGLAEAGIRTGFFLQFGYPGEGAAEITATVGMVRDLLPEEIGISVSYPLPGTPFYDRVIEEMEEQQNWSESADLAMMFRGAYATGYYRELARFLHADHRLRLGLRAASRLINRTPVSQAEARRLLLTPWYLLHREYRRLKMWREDGPWRFFGKSDGAESIDDGSRCPSTAGAR